MVESREVKGAVYALAPFQGKLLAAVNSKVHVFKWTPAGGNGNGGGGGAELVSETSTPVQVLSLFLAARCAAQPRFCVIVAGLQRQCCCWQGGVLPCFLQHRLPRSCIHPACLLVFLPFVCKTLALVHTAPDTLSPPSPPPPGVTSSWWVT